VSLDLPALRAAVARHGRVARVVVAEARGSAPREAGAAMLVWEGAAGGGQAGTIGGGALEYEAAARARAALAGGGAGTGGGGGLVRRPLGPALGQCCGGAVTLLTEVFDAAALDALDPDGGIWARPVAAGAAPVPPLAVARLCAAIRRGTDAPRTSLVAGWLIEPVARPRHALWLHGAGHVGRALAAVIAPLPDWTLTWVDTAPERFPEAPPAAADVLVATDPARAVAHAPRDAHHLIMTYSHALDLALCDAVLRRGFSGAGLIGSATKRARFATRLAAMGHAPAAIARIACPIGDPALGKHPQAIALGAATALLRAVATAPPAALPAARAP